MHAKTVILLENYSLASNSFVHLSTTFSSQRVLTFAILNKTNEFFTFFILGVNVFYINGWGCRDPRFWARGSWGRRGSWNI